MENGCKAEYEVSSLPMRVLSGFSRTQLFATPRTVAPQAPLSKGFSRQEYWRGLPFPPPGDLPGLGSEPTSFASPALAGEFFTAEPRKPYLSLVKLRCALFSYISLLLPSAKPPGKWLPFVFCCSVGYTICGPRAN